MNDENGDEIPEDGDDLDGCDIDFADDPTPQDLVDLMVLFPDGNPDPEKAAFYSSLTEGDR